MKNEISRKMIHLAMLFVPLLYLLTSKGCVLLVSGATVFIALLVEILRRVNQKFSNWFNETLGRLLRQHELTGLTGATFLFIGSFLAILLFEKWIALAVLLFLILADGLSALIGKLIGKKKIKGNKTIAGSVAFLISALAIAVIFFHHHLLIACAGAITAFTVDVFVAGIDDNLSIPIAAGSVMQLLVWGFC